jgi:hypothetical protein
VTARTLAVTNAFRASRVVMFASHPAYARTAQAVAHLLRKRGIPTELRQGMSFRTRAEMQFSRDVWLGFWFGVPLTCLPRTYVAWNPEPLDQPRDRTGVTEEFFRLLEGATRVWEYKRENASELDARKITWTFVPFGYAPSYEDLYRQSIDETTTEDIDVLFFGSMCERRERLLKVLEARGHNVFIANEQRTAYGKELDRLLARSKVVLGIHYFTEPVAQIADLARVAYPISNRRFVIHERPEAPTSDPAFAQTVVCPPYADVVATIEHFLEVPGERRDHAERAYEWFKQSYSLDEFIPFDDIADLVEQLNRRQSTTPS